MIAWVVIYRRHLRRSRQSGSLSRLFLFDIPTCKPSNVSTFGFPYTLPSSVSRNLFCLPLLRKLPGCIPTIPFLERARPERAEGPVITLRSTQVPSFHILTHSFARANISTLLFSIVSALFVKNHPGWGEWAINVERKSGGSFCRCIPTSLRPYFFPQGTASARRADYRQSPRAAGTVAAAAQALSPSILSRCG